LDSISGFYFLDAIHEFYFFIFYFLDSIFSSTLMMRSAAAARASRPGFIGARSPPLDRRSRARIPPKRIWGAIIAVTRRLAVEDFEALGVLGAL